MRKAAFHPAACPFRQERWAINIALGLIYEEMMSWPLEERPIHVAALEPKGQAIRVHYATEVWPWAERTVTAFVPVLWDKLALVENRKTDLLHHLPLVSALNERLRQDGLLMPPTGS